MSLNLYGYVKGNPLKCVDPSGHVAEYVLVGAFVDGPLPFADIAAGVTYLGINASHYGPKLFPHIMKYMQYANMEVESADQVANGDSNGGSSTPQMDPNDPKWRDK